jgi:hypothetical protein
MSVSLQCKTQYSICPYSWIWCSSGALKNRMIETNVRQVASAVCCCIPFAKLNRHVCGIGQRCVSYRTFTNYTKQYVNPAIRAFYTSTKVRNYYLFRLVIIIRWDKNNFRGI